MSDSAQNPGPQELQFQHAEPVSPTSGSAVASPLCVACKRPVGATYFHAQGHVICPGCAGRIKAGQQQPATLSLARALLYGGGAALGGCILYAVVSIITGFEFGLMAIVVGYMVGRAIRYASNGLGGRPQQILAVVLTYFAITTSYIPVYIHNIAKHQPSAQSQKASDQPANAPVEQRYAVSPGVAVMYLLLLAAAAPFLSLGSGLSGLLSLFIIFIGLQRAWRLTGRTDILIMGPYQTAPAQ